MFEYAAIYYIDLDDTMFFHKENILNVYVRDINTNNILDCIKYHDYIAMRDKQPPNGCKYDFSVFSSAAMFEKSAIPNPKIFTTISNIKRIQRDYCLENILNIEILTARSDFDDQERFARFMMSHNIDINNNIHVRRAGNEKGKTAGERKLEVINREIKRNFYYYYIVYDDCDENLGTIYNAHESRINEHRMFLYKVTKEEITKFRY